jgi:hypothetical protein
LVLAYSVAMSDLIVSLTSTPPRFPFLRSALEQFLCQTAPVAEVRLNIPRSYRRFGPCTSLPDVPKGVRIVRTEEDFGPASKVLPTVFDHRGQDVEILFCDDDEEYDPEWAGRFLASRAQHPKAAIVGKGYHLASLRGYHLKTGAAFQPRAQRGNKVIYGLYHLATGFRRKLGYFRRPGFVDILEGYRGALVRPEFFPPDAALIPPDLWLVDDPWLSGQMMRLGVPIWAMAGLPSRAMGIGAAQEVPLRRLVHNGKGRRALDIACINHLRETYGIWPEDGARNTGKA